MSCFKSLKDKKWNGACPLQNGNKAKSEIKRGGGSSCCRTKMVVFREKVSDFSLDL